MSDITDDDALEIAREAWLHEHGKLKKDVMRDESGEFVLAGEVNVASHLVCYEKIYLPNDLQANK